MVWPVAGGGAGGPHLARPSADDDRLALPAVRLVAAACRVTLHRTGSLPAQDQPAGAAPDAAASCVGRPRPAHAGADPRTAAAGCRRGAGDAAADASEQQKLADKAARAREKAEAARELAIKKAQEAGLEPQGLEQQPADAMPYRGLAHRADGSPTAKTQRNHRCAEGCAYTDPDSHIVKSDGNVLQGYNCQAVVDGDHQVIVAMGVSNQPPDVEHLVPMLERTIANTSQVPKTLIADAGYWSEDNAKACEDRGVDPHIATGRLPHGQPPPPIHGPIPKDLNSKGRMARKLRKKAGREIYARRKTIVEPVFGQTKESRGLRRFLLRGLEKVNDE